MPEHTATHTHARTEAIKIIRWHNKHRYEQLDIRGLWGRNAPTRLSLKRDQPSHLGQLGRAGADGAAGPRLRTSAAAFVTFHPSCSGRSRGGSPRRRVSSEGQFKMPWVACCCDTLLSSHAEASLTLVVNETVWSHTAPFLCQIAADLHRPDGKKINFC